MTALLLLLFSLAAERHRRLRRATSKKRLAQQRRHLGFSDADLAGDVDTRLARGVVGCSRGGPAHTVGDPGHPFHGLRDCVGRGGVVVVRRAPSRLVAVPPVRVRRAAGHGAINAVGKDVPGRTRLCPGWPGPGLHSTPLWEWIAFTCLIAFLFWIARGVGPAPQTGPGEKPTSTALKPR